MIKTDIEMIDFLSEEEKEFLNVFRRVPFDLKQKAIEEIYSMATTLSDESAEIKASVTS